MTHGMKQFFNLKFFSLIQEQGTISVLLVGQLFMMFWSFLFVFFLCEFGEFVSDRFSECYNVIYEYHWYLCTTEVQRLIPIILIGTQYPITIRGFGNISCDRYSFKRVTNIYKPFYFKMNVKRYTRFLINSIIFRLSTADFHILCYCVNCNFSES